MRIETQINLGAWERCGNECDGETVTRDPDSKRRVLSFSLRILLLRLLDREYKEDEVRDAFRWECGSADDELLRI